MLRAYTLTLTALHAVFCFSLCFQQLFIIIFRAVFFSIQADGIQCLEHIRNRDSHLTSVAAVTTGGTWNRRTLFQRFLCFAASLPGVATVLSGMSNEEQMEDNIKTFRNFVPLNEEEKAVIAKAECPGRNRCIRMNAFHLCFNLFAC